MVAGPADLSLCKPGHLSPAPDGEADVRILATSGYAPSARRVPGRLLVGFLSRFHLGVCRCPEVLAIDAERGEGANESASLETARCRDEVRSPQQRWLRGLRKGEGVLEHPLRLRRRARDAASGSAQCGLAQGAIPEVDPDRCQRSLVRGFDGVAQLMRINTDALKGTYRCAVRQGRCGQQQVLRAGCFLPPRRASASA